MIFSSADILRVLGGNQIIRATAKLQIVDGKPPITGDEGLFIYIDRYPSASEFQATWKLWVADYSDEPVDLVLEQMQSLLPGFQIRANGLVVEAFTTELLSKNTQLRPKDAPAASATVDMSAFEERFQTLVEDVNDRMLLVHSGTPGRDGRDGRDGVDGTPGRDMIATDANLEDLQNVEQGINKEKGQVLTWDGLRWTNLFVPQILSAGGSGGGGGQFGVSATVQWKYSGLLTGSDPVSGTFLTNSEAGNLVTTIRVSKDTHRGNDISVLIRDLLLQGYDRLYVAQSEDLSQAQLYSVTGSSETPNSFILTVSHVDTAGTEPNFVHNKDYEFYISLSASGAGGGSTTLIGLNDVNIQSPQNLQVLQYNSSTSRWVNATLSLPSGQVTSVNSQTGAVVLDADDIPVTGTVNKFTTAADITKLAGIQAGAEVNVNADWNAVSGDAQILNKPTLGTAASQNSTAFATAAQGTKADSALQPAAIGVTVQAYNINTVVDPIYVHTDNNYTTAEKTKLSGIAPGAEVNVNADWNASTGDALILNKPTLGTAAAQNTTAFATAAQGTKADSALQPAAIGVTVQAYNANTVIDAAYVHTDNNYTTAEKTKLAGIQAGAQVNQVNEAPIDGTSYVRKDGAWVAGGGGAVSSVNGQTGAVVLNADNISTTGTTNKFTTAADITKLAGIAAGAEVNVNADWNAASGDAQILNKPTLGTAAAQNTTAFATAAQGTKADSALQPANIGVTVQPYNAATVVDAAYVHTDNNFTTAEKTKLAGLSGGSTVDFQWDANTDTYTTVPVADRNIDVQARIKRCILTNAGVVTYLDADDSTKLAGNWVRLCETTTLSTPFTGTHGAEVANTRLRGKAAAWAAGTYFKGEIVTHSGSLWECVVDSTTATPAAGSAAATLTTTTTPVMVEIPVFSVKHVTTPSGDYKSHQMSVRYGVVTTEGFAVHPAFIRSDGGIRKFVYVGAYHGTGTSGNGSNSGVLNTATVARATARTAAAGRATNWHTMSYWIYNAIQWLVITEYQDVNSQRVLGYGASLGDTYSVNTGVSNSRGNRCGHAHTPTTGSATDFMSYRGIENFYGRNWQMLDGCNPNSLALYLHHVPAQFADSVATNYSAYLEMAPSKASGTGRDLTSGAALFPDSIVGGTNATFVSDVVTINSGWRLAMIGGSASDGADGGMFAWSSFPAANAAGANIGMRLCFSAP